MVYYQLDYKKELDEVCNTTLKLNWDKLKLVNENGLRTTLLHRCRNTVVGNATNGVESQEDIMLKTKKGPLKQR